MTSKIEYRVIPHNRYMIVRFHSDENGAGSEQRGEFMNEREAEEVATLLAKADVGATFISRASLNRLAQGAQIGGEKGGIAWGLIYLTPHDTKSSPSAAGGDLPPAGAPVVTLEMLEAGLDALRQSGAVEHPLEWSDRRLVENIFRAMIGASPPELSAWLPEAP